MDAQVVIARLESEFGYPSAGARLIADKLAAATPEVRAAFIDWWETGKLPAFAVEGYTANRLVEEHSMRPIAALLTLDWLIREPEQAKASLRKGHDHVRV